MLCYVKLYFIVCTLLYMVFCLLLLHFGREQKENKAKVVALISCKREDRKLLEEMIPSIKIGYLGCQSNHCPSLLEYVLSKARCSWRIY